MSHALDQQLPLCQHQAMSLEGNKAHDATAPTMQSPFVFNRWKRYGHNRVYVADLAGSKLGHINVATGEFSLEPSTDEDLVRTTARTWFAENDIALNEPAPTSPSPALDSADLPPKPR